MSRTAPGAHAHQAIEDAVRARLAARDAASEAEADWRVEGEIERS